MNIWASDVNGNKLQLSTTDVASPVNNTDCLTVHEGPVPTRVKHTYIHMYVRIYIYMQNLNAIVG